MNIYRLTFGDYSTDGHERQLNVFLETDVDCEKIEEALRIGTRPENLDPDISPFIVCNDSYNITAQQRQKIIDLTGIDLAEDEYEDEEGFLASTEAFIDYVLWILHRQLPTVVITRTNIPQIKLPSSLGYGMLI